LQTTEGGKGLTGKARYWIRDETVLALDLSDISKKYSEKREYLDLGREKISFL
jgi:hypothetical protein